MRGTGKRVATDGERAGSVRRWLLERARELGFTAVGIADPRRVPDPDKLRHYLARGHQAGMGYLERHADLRVDPQRFFSGTKSILCVALNYFQPDPVPRAGSTTAAGKDRDLVPRVSRYAWGADYHTVLRAKLRALLAELAERVPGVRGRVAVDSAPVLERHWAQQAGLGWVGRNCCLIVPRVGSWVFLGELFLDLPLPADRAQPDRCGRCRRCLEACPTKALVAAGQLDARRCIAYWTVEHRGAFPPGGAPPIAPWVFGCDICQEACPWNRAAPVAAEPALQPRGDWMRWDCAAWGRLTRTDFERLLGETALARTGWDGLQRNLSQVCGSPGPGPELRQG